jgi:hypothetical protein
VTWRFAAAIGAAAVFGAAAAPAAAQAPLTVSIQLPPVGRRTTDGPIVTIENLFADRRSQELLASGFRARLLVTVELWRSRAFGDELLGQVTSERAVKFDPVRKAYFYARYERDTWIDEGQRSSLDSVRSAVGAAQHEPIMAPASTRGLYYTVSVTVETLNSDDLNEVKHWVKGDLQPALSGKRDAGTALSRTFGWLFSRLFGGDTKHASQSTGKFDT